MWFALYVPEAKRREELLEEFFSLSLVFRLVRYFSLFFPLSTSVSLSFSVGVSYRFAKSESGLVPSLRPSRINNAPSCLFRYRDTPSPVPRPPEGKKTFSLEGFPPVFQCRFLRSGVESGE